MESPYNTCQWCNNAIAYGNAMLTINRNIEQVDRTTRHPYGVATVLQSDVLLTLCGGCSKNLDLDALTHLLAAPIRRSID